MQNNNDDQHGHTCDRCGEGLHEEGHVLADQRLCDDCYIDTVAPRKAHKTSYANDPSGYFRRLKENETVLPQQLH